MKPVFARFGVLTFVGIMCGISINAIFLQEGRLARFEGDPRLRDTVVVAKPINQNKIRHVAAIRPKAGQNRKIEDVLREYDKDRLKENLRLSVISEIQKLLVHKGYHPGTVDGIAGPTTRAAIMAFEFDNKLALTGYPGEDLLAVLSGERKNRGSSAPKHILEQGQELVSALQRALIHLGYNTGTADGIFGPMTRKHIKAFERDHKLKVTGRISGRLIETINKIRGYPIVLAKLN